jgi:hypothetical protein
MAKLLRNWGNDENPKRFGYNPIILENASDVKLFRDEIGIDTGPKIRYNRHILREQGRSLLPCGVLG